MKKHIINVCKVQVNKYCMSGHMAGLEISKGKYPLQKTVMLTKILPKGSFGETLEDIFQGLVPSKNDNWYGWCRSI